jgi:hypothetical protein
VAQIRHADAACRERDRHARLHRRHRHRAAAGAIRKIDLWPSALLDAGPLRGYAAPMFERIPLLLLVACGGAAPPEASPAASPAAPSAGSPTPTQASPIDAFHDVLAPLWHSPEGAERTEKTCTSIPTLEERAQDVGDPALGEAVRALAAECAGDRAGFEPRFAAVHDAFHALMEKGGHHGHHPR